MLKTYRLQLLTVFGWRTHASVAGLWAAVGLFEELLPARLPGVRILREDAVPVVTVLEPRPKSLESRP